MANKLPVIKEGVVSPVRATCPTPNPPLPQSWQIISVTYNYPTPGLPPGYLTFLPMSSLGISGDIDSAFNEWTYANQAKNGTNVGFYAGGTNGPFRIYAYRVNYPGQLHLDPGRAAYTTVALYAGTRQIAFVGTDLYFGSISSVGGYPVYDQNASNSIVSLKKSSCTRSGTRWI